MSYFCRLKLTKCTKTTKIVLFEQGKKKNIDNLQTIYQEIFMYTVFKCYLRIMKLVRTLY